MEVDSLKAALQGAEAPYRALIVTPPTLDALHEALAPRGRQTIVHFIGHGLATKQGAILLFEDEAGIGRAISARDFAHRVNGQYLPHTWGLDAGHGVVPGVPAHQGQLGDLQGKSVTRAMRGQLLAAAGEKALALQDFVQALATLANIGAHDAGQVVDMIRRLRGDVSDEEFNNLWRTVTGQEELPEWLAESSKTNIDRLLTLATTQEEQKDWKAANATYSEVLSLLQSRTLSNDEQRRHAETVLRLGVCLRQDGQWGAAVECHQEAFRLFKRLKDFHGQGLAYLETARAYQATNSYDLAMLYYKDASRLFKRAGDPALAAAAHEEAGNLQVYLRAFPGAIVDLQEAVRLYREANIPSRSTIVDQNLELARQSHE
jgi:tetratricopeptide (TPR) repeat protein